MGKYGSVSTFMRRISGSSMRVVYIFVETARRCLLCKNLDTDVDKTCFVVRGAGSRGTEVEGCSEISWVVGDEICYFGGGLYGVWV